MPPVEAPTAAYRRSMPKWSSSRSCESTTSANATRGKSAPHSSPPSARGDAGPLDP